MQLSKLYSPCRHPTKATSTTGPWRDVLIELRLWGRNRHRQKIAIEVVVVEDEVAEVEATDAEDRQKCILGSEPSEPSAIIEWYKSKMLMASQNFNDFIYKHGEKYLIRQFKLFRIIHSYSPLLIFNRRQVKNYKPLAKLKYIIGFFSSFLLFTCLRSPYYFAYIEFFHSPFSSKKVVFGVKMFNQ